MGQSRAQTGNGGQKYVQKSSAACSAEVGRAETNTLIILNSGWVDQALDLFRRNWWVRLITCVLGSLSSGKAQIARRLSPNSPGTNNRPAGKRSWDRTLHPTVCHRVPATYKVEHVQVTQQHKEGTHECHKEGNRGTISEKMQWNSFVSALRTGGST